MNSLAFVLASLLLVTVTSVHAQDRPAAGLDREQGVPGRAGPGPGAVQHGAQPNPAQVRPGSPEGDAPSASAGTLVKEPERRIFGLPVTAALLIGAVLIVLFVIAGVVIPGARRRERPRGGGTYGRP